MDTTGGIELLLLLIATIMLLSAGQVNKLRQEIRELKEMLQQCLLRNEASSESRNEP